MFPYPVAGTEASLREQCLELGDEVADLLVADPRRTAGSSRPWSPARHLVHWLGNWWLQWMGFENQMPGS
jgi:hypothetical protein